MITVAFNQLAILFSLSVFFGFLAIKLRQPLVLSFIAVGVIAGPSMLGWITPHSGIEILANFGVTILLFIVGLKLDFDLIKTFGRVTVLIGISQIIITAVIGFLLALTLSISVKQAFFVGIALTFSSTIIIIKLLSDRFEIDSLHGRISIGVLLVQDLVVILAIIVMSSLSMPIDGKQHLINEIFVLLLKGIGFLTAIGLLMRYVLPRVIAQIAESTELLILFALTWAVILAVTAEYLGFGKEVGGFVAGVSLASTIYRESIASRLDTVRGVLLLFFFLNLGASLHFSDLQQLLIPAIILSLFVLIIKPVIVMILMERLGFHMRTAFLTGIAMGQLSEFSLILAALGGNLGYIDSNVQGMITFIAVITIGVSTYLIAYSTKLYERVSPWLKRFEHAVQYKEKALPSQSFTADVIIYGWGRHGQYIAQLLMSQGHSILGIDFDPQKIERSSKSNIVIRYGDAEDAEFQKTLPISTAKWVVCTVPHLETNQMLVSSLRELGYAGKIALYAYREGEVKELKKLKVDVIFIPYREAAQSAAQYLIANML